MNSMCVRSTAKAGQAVLELYEPIDLLDDMLARATAVPLIVPGVLLALHVEADWRLVSHARAISMAHRARWR